MNKKKIFALAVAVIMIAILSFGTLAWFSDGDSVTNRFQVAGGDDADKIFSVDVMEAVDVNGDGKFDAANDTAVEVGDQSRQLQTKIPLRHAKHHLYAHHGGCGGHSGG